jgi:phosphoglycerate dehydrogenase-like enzyme
VDALAAALTGADVVVEMRERTAFDAETFAALPDLRLLVTTGTANAAIDLDGRTLGVVGLGRLGSKVAAIGKAFGMDVIAWSQNLDPALAVERGARAVTKDELFATADFVTVHYKLGPRSVGVVGGPSSRS